MERNLGDRGLADLNGKFIAAIESGLIIIFGLKK